MSIEINHVTKYFDRTEVLHDVNLTVNSGEMMALLGPGHQAQVKPHYYVSLQDLSIKRKVKSVLQGKMSVVYMPASAKLGLFSNTMHCFAI